jgi:hypothetical protein
MSKRRRLAFVLVISVSVVWAALEARNLGQSQPTPAGTGTSSPEPATVEADFADVVVARREGRREEALLRLRDRATRGPHAGHALFLLGEMAYAEGAYAAAVRHYRKAVETDAYVADRGSAFSSAREISTRLEAILAGPWADRRPAEVRDLYYLQRRLAGGCE